MSHLDQALNLELAFCTGGNLRMDCEGYIGGILGIVELSETETLANKTPRVKALTPTKFHFYPSPIYLERAIASQVNQNILFLA